MLNDCLLNTFMEKKSALNVADDVETYMALYNVDTF